MDLQLFRWSITETEHSAFDRLILRQPLLAVAEHREARAQLFAVARLQPASPEDLKKKCISLVIVGLGSSDKMSQLIGDVGLGVHAK